MATDVLRTCARVKDVAVLGARCSALPHGPIADGDGCEDDGDVGHGEDRDGKRAQDLEDVVEELEEHGAELHVHPVQVR